MMGFKDMTFCIAACATTSCPRMLKGEAKNHIAWVADFSEHCDEHTIFFPDELPMEPDND